jgi:hypothetical protein
MVEGSDARKPWNCRWADRSRPAVLVADERTSNWARVRCVPPAGEPRYASANECRHCAFWEANPDGGTQQEA